MFLRKIVLALMAFLVFSLPAGAGRISFDIGIGPLGLMSIVGLLAFLFAISYQLFGHRGLGNAEFPMDLSVTLFGIFVALNFASVGWAQSPSLAISSSIVYLQLLVFIWLLLFLRSEPRGFGVMLHAFFLGSFLVLAISLYDVASVGLEAVQDNRYEGFDIHTNILAFKLALGIAVAFYLFGRGHPALRWLYLSYIPGAAFLALLTGSRTGFVLLLFALLLGLWSIVKVEDRGQARFSYRILLVSAGVLIALALSVMPFLTEHLEFQTDRIATLTDAEDFGGRTDLWAAALATYWENPLLGVGSGGSGMSMLDQKGHEGLVIALNIRPRPAHNAFLGIASETGSIGALIFLAILGSLIVRIRSLPRSERLLFLSLMGVALLAGSTLSLEQGREFWFALFLSIVLASPHRSGRIIDAEVSHRMYQSSRVSRGHGAQPGQ